MKALNKEQFDAIFKVLNESDYDGTCSHVINAFERNFKPDSDTEEILSSNESEHESKEMAQYLSGLPPTMIE
jgi:hypothetical protein